MNQMPKVGIIKAGQVVKTPHHGSFDLVLIYPDGTPAVTVKKQANQVDTVAVDLAALKVDFNALLAKLRLAGILG